jgi:pantothenate kinase
MRVIGLGGEPATGKTTLMRRLIDELPDSHEEFKIETVRGRVYNDQEIIILGVYDDSEDTFQGTDRLSMSVLPEAKDMISNLEDHFGEGDWTILFEGDRLFTGKFINHILNLTQDLHLLFLDVDQDVIEKRHEDRGDDQTEQFINGRRTKYRRLRRRFDLREYQRVLENNNGEDLEKNYDILREVVFDEEGGK